MADGPTLHTLHVGDAPISWTQAGFSVNPSSGTTPAAVDLGGIRLVLHGDGGPRGLLRWDLEAAPAAGVVMAADAGGPPRPADLDGLPTGWVTASSSEPASAGMEDDDHAPHANGVIGLDHVVISSPDVDRTTAALAEVGFEARRTRETSDYGEPMRQVFFWAGSVIIELVGPIVAEATTSDQPGGQAAFFGLAMISSDLDATAATLGGAMGAPRPAVQPGRQIASLRFKLLGGSVATVVMSPHPTGE